MAGALSLIPPEIEMSSDPIVLRKERVTAPDALRGAVQRTMSADCGVVRDARSLERAGETLADLAALAVDLPAREMATYEVINLLRVSRMIVASALAREESRGAHTRADFPDTDDAWLGRLVVRGEMAPQFVELPALAVER
jgi:L-aspartate oxidase